MFSTLEAFRAALPGMLDLSCVRADNTASEIEEMAALAEQLHCAAVFAMPANTAALVRRMRGSGVTVGGVVGFPAGCEETETKRFIADRLLGYGCGEIDMVINQSALKSGDNDLVFADMQAICRLCGAVPVKVILEVNNLSDEEIARGCKLATEAGAAFVKSGTGWHPKPTLPRHIELMRASAGENVRIKAAGGVRDLQTAYEMHLAGCTRFGESVHSARLLLG